MAIPDYQSVMLPLLKATSDGKEHFLADLRDDIAKAFGLTDQELKELLPSGTQPVLNNRVAWACIYLHRAGLLKRPKRGYYQVTERGLDVLKGNPSKIDVKYLEQFPEFIEFRTKKNGKRDVLK